MLKTNTWGGLKWTGLPTIPWRSSEGRGRTGIHPGENPPVWRGTPPPEERVAFLPNQKETLVGEAVSSRLEKQITSLRETAQRLKSTQAGSGESRISRIRKRKISHYRGRGSSGSRGLSTGCNEGTDFQGEGGPQTGSVPNGAAMLGKTCLMRRKKRDGSKNVCRSSTRSIRARPAHGSEHRQFEQALWGKTLPFDFNDLVWCHAGMCTENWQSAMWTQAGAL